MARLRVKLILNEGGEGVPLSQLTDIADEAEKFLRYLAQDAGLTIQRGEWLARNFVNESVRFDIEKESYQPIDSVKEFNRLFEVVDTIKANAGQSTGEVRHRTLVQYAKVAESLGPHEKLAFGLYRPDDPDESKPYRFAPLTKREAVNLASFLSQEITYRGSIQGQIHSLGVAELNFQLRSSRSKELIKCEFKEALYNEVIEACEQRRSRVFVHGLITVRRVDRHISLIKAEKLRTAPTLSEERYRAFFGSDPNYTGEMSSEEFTDRNLDYEH
jgi:hypothetical protein